MQPRDLISYHHWIWLVLVDNFEQRRAYLLWKYHTWKSSSDDDVPHWPLNQQDLIDDPPRSRLMDPINKVCRGKAAWKASKFNNAKISKNLSIFLLAFSAASSWSRFRRRWRKSSAEERRSSPSERLVRLSPSCEFAAFLLPSSESGHVVLSLLHFTYWILCLHRQAQDWRNDFYKYRVTIQIVPNLPLTPKLKYSFSTWASY